MLNITKEEIVIEDSLLNKINDICAFSGKQAIIINGCLRYIKKTNIAYIEPHKCFIDGNLYLVFNGNDTIYINDLTNPIKLSELEKYLGCCP